MSTILLGGCSYSNENVPTDNKPKAEIFAGEGTINSPYIIKSLNNLLYLADSVDNEKISYQGQYFILESDIDMNGYDWKPIGGGFAWGNVEFMGNFDGKGHTISNFNITSVWTREAGFFGSCANNLLSNISIKNATIQLDVGHHVATVGLIVGYAKNSQFYNCSANGKIDVSTDAAQQDIGGIVGNSFVSTPGIPIIKDCKSEIEITTNGPYPNVGGIVGCSTNVDLVGCETKSNIEYTSTMSAASGGSYNGIGGLIGVNLRSDVIDCNVYTSILGGEGIWVVGGLIGYSEWADIDNCHVAGSIKRKNITSAISPISDKLISSGGHNNIKDNCTCDIVCEFIQ